MKERFSYPPRKIDYHRCPKFIVLIMLPLRDVLCKYNVITLLRRNYNKKVHCYYITLSTVLTTHKSCYYCNYNTFSKFTDVTQLLFVLCYPYLNIRSTCFVYGHYILP